MGSVSRAEWLSATFLRTLAQCQTRFLVVLDETRDDRSGSPQQKLNLRARAVACAQPNHLRWRTPKNTSLLKIRVFGHHGQTGPTRIDAHARNQDRCPRVTQPGEEGDSRQKAVSLGNRFQFAFPIGSKSEARPNVLFGQIGKFLQKLLVRHSTSQVFQYVINSDSEPANTRFPAAFTEDDPQLVDL